MRPHLNREGWLTQLAHQIEPIFRGMKLPSYRLTCGWPSRNALSHAKRRIGECHGQQVSSAGVFELFISPLLDKPGEVAGTVCHELTHVAAGIEAGHKGKFIKISKQIGLTKGKPTTAQPGKELAERLERIWERLGQYPHSAIIPVFSKAKPATSRITLRCRCGCSVQISTDWVAKAGLPTCGCGKEMEPK